MRTSCTGVGAFLWDFTKALFLHICVYLYIFPLWRRCFPSGFHQSPRLVHKILLLGFCLSRVCGWFFGLVACFWQCLDDVWHHFVLMAIASITPLFSWLKGDPPGTYPSSCQQKKDNHDTSKESAKMLFSLHIVPKFVCTQPHKKAPGVQWRRSRWKTLSGTCLCIYDLKLRSQVWKSVKTLEAQELVKSSPQNSFYQVFTCNCFFFCALADRAWSLVGHW